MSNLVDKEIELQVMTCLDALLDRANHDEYLGRIGKKEALKYYPHERGVQMNLFDYINEEE